MQQDDGVWLVVEGSWHLPAFWFTAETDLTVDICTPPTFRDGTWSFVDLELDLFRRPDGRAGIVDQDEWEALVAADLLSDDEVITAEGAARSLLPLVEDRVEPFGAAALPWLRSLAGPPA